MVLWLVNFHVSGLPENSKLRSCGKLLGLSVLTNKTCQQNINVPQGPMELRGQGMLPGKGLGTEVAMGQRVAVVPKAGRSSCCWPNVLAVPWPCSCNYQMSQSDLTPLGLTLGSPIASESVWQRCQITPLSAALLAQLASGKRKEKHKTRTSASVMYFSLFWIMPWLARMDLLIGLGVARRT